MPPTIKIVLLSLFLLSIGIILCICGAFVYINIDPTALDIYYSGYRSGIIEGAGISNVIIGFLMLAFSQKLTK